MWFLDLQTLLCKTSELAFVKNVILASPLTWQKGASDLDSNVCLGCRFGSVKIEILVPEKCDINEFAEETRNFSLDIIAMTKEKPMHYSLTFASGNEVSKLDFKVHCTCILNIDKKECSKFSDGADKEYKIKHLVYSKASSDEQVEIKVRQ